MLEIRRVWRGLKRMILSGSTDEARTFGERTVLDGRTAIEYLGRRLDVRGAGSRDELATTLGLATGGLRATTWLSRTDPGLAIAVEQRLPVVAHVALSDDTDYAVLAAATHAGWTTLHPRNVQEAIDLTLAAHHLAEQSLTPVLVACDNGEIVDSFQDARLPDTEQCLAIVGHEADTIETPTPAQRLLFGNERRRLPKYFDLDRPTMHGVHGTGLEAASGHAFFARHVRELLDTSLQHVAAATGRELAPTFAASNREADHVLVACGAAIEVATAVAAALAARETTFDVVGVRCPSALEPGDLARQLHDRTVVALEPGATLTAARAMLQLPHDCAVHTAYYGFPDHALRAADLFAYCQKVYSGHREDVCLGLQFLPESGDYPKREILNQQLRRDYGELEDFGLRAHERLDLRGATARTVTVCRTATDGGEELAPGLAGLLAEVPETAVRSRIDRRPRGYGLPIIDHVTAGAADMVDPGAAVPTDVLVLLHGAIPKQLELAEGCAALVPLTGDDAVASLPATTLRDLRVMGAELFVVPIEPRTAPHESPLPEAVLGAVCGILQRRGIDLNTRRAVQARDGVLAELPREEYLERIGDFARGIESVRAVDWLDVEVAASADAADAPEVPLAVQGVENVPRFWDQVGVLYRHGEEAELAPDPFQACGTLPPLTATLHDLSTKRRTIRSFEPESCTGCGECWTVCPDCALGPAAFGFDDLLTAGMAGVKARGQSADALRPLLSKLVARSQKVLAATETTTTAGPVLRMAFEYVLDKAAPAADRRAALTAAFDLVAAQVGEFPIAKAAPFANHGELLTVAVHVEACKACGACTEVCATGAILGIEQTADLVATARRNWQVFERLPDTKDTTIARVTEDEDVGQAAATLLDKHAMFTLSGGDTAEPGSGEKIAVHLALAAAEQHLQPRMQRHLQDVTELEQKLTAKIQELLTGALPTDDLESLAHSLDELSGRHVDLSALTAKTEASGDRTPVDAAWLRALTRSARQLRELRDRLAMGKNGLGRARVGLLVAKGNIETWAAAFPYNPFPVPVVLDRAGATAELARGLCTGQLETVLDDVRLLRRARLELERPVEAESQAAALANLTFADLTTDERAVCPPLLLIGGDDSLGARGLTELATVLSGDLPIKLLVLTGLDFALQDDSRLGRQSESTDVPHGDTGLLAMAHRRAFVVQASIGDADHLIRGCLGAFEHEGPALLHVHAPSPQRHGFATHLTREQARRALSAGAHPRFTYDPDAKGLFGLRLTLQDDPPTDGTLADFAVTEGRFAHHFAPLADDAEMPTELTEWLALERPQRAGRTPFLVVDEQQLQVSTEMALACADRRHAQQVLQELAGVVTPFTERVETDASARVAADHDRALTELRNEYEGKLAQMRASLQQEFTTRLRDRLVELADRHREGATR